MLNRFSFGSEALLRFFVVAIMLVLILDREFILSQLILLVVFVVLQVNLFNW